MVKKIFLLSLLFIFLFVGVVQADNDLLRPRILPGNPLYFFTVITEGVGTFFTFGDIKKANRYLMLAERRLAEADALAEKGDLERTKRAVEKYQERLSNADQRVVQAKEKGLDVNDILIKISEAIPRHQEILTRVYEQVPEQAKEAIGKASDASRKEYEIALQTALENLERKKVDIIEQIKESSSTSQLNGESINCGSDFDCLIEASKSCKPSFLTRILPLNIFGMTLNATVYYEIQGAKGKKCKVLWENKNVELEFSEEIKQQMLADGMTEAQIQENKKEASQVAMGTRVACAIDTQILTSLLRELEHNPFSTDKWASFGCEIEVINISTGEATGPSISQSAITCEGFCTESCPGCKTDYAKCAYGGDKNNDGWADPFCRECTSAFGANDCKDGYLCIMEKCIAENQTEAYLGNVGDICAYSSDCQEGLKCVWEIQYQNPKICSQGLTDDPCIFDYNCNEDFHCFQNECLSNTFIEDLNSCAGCFGEPCEGCDSGEYYCSGNRTSAAYQKCIACESDSWCIEGYVCDAYRCVVGN